MVNFESQENKDDLAGEATQEPRPEEEDIPSSEEMARVGRQYEALLAEHGLTDDEGSLLNSGVFMRKTPLEEQQQKFEELRLKYRNNPAALEVIDRYDKESELFRLQEDYVVALLAHDDESCSRREHSFYQRRLKVLEDFKKREAKSV